MRAFFVALIVLLNLQSGFCGKDSFIKVDMEQIRSEVSNSESPNHYPKLLERLTKLDTSLTLVEYRYLYYGFAFQETYTGMNNIRKKEIYELIENKKFKRAMDVCDSALTEVPVSLSLNFIKLFLAQKIDETSFDVVAYRQHYLGILLTILTSGDGKSAKSAYKTILISDDYDIAYTFYQIEEVTSQEFIDLSNVLMVKPNKTWKKKKMYFDASEYIKRVAELSSQEGNE